MTAQTPRLPAMERSTPGSGVGFALLLAFLFATHSRLFDFIVPPFRLIALLGGAAALVALITGSLFRAIRHPVTLCLLAFTVWAAISIPFSVWRAGSLDTLMGWLRSFLVFGLITAFTTTYSRLLTVVKVIAASVFVFAGLTYALGTAVLGRLTVQASKFGNPNDLAQVLLMTMPLWWFLAFRPGVALLWKLLNLVCLAVLLGAFVQTGSRAGLLGLAAVLLAFFLLGSLKRRILMAVGTLVVLGAVFGFAPRILLERYTTVFQPAPGDETGETEAEARAEEAATTSAMSRWQHLKESLTLTMQHPFLGVGLGQFMVAQNDLAQELGRRGSWRLTHNMYTQISAETGIPGLLFYLGALLGCWRALRRASPRDRAPTERPEASLLAENLVLMFVAFAVTAFFSSVAYDVQFPLLAGMAVVLSRLDLKLPAASALPVPRTPLGAARPVPTRRLRTPASVRPAGTRYPGGMIDSSGTIIHSERLQ